MLELFICINSFLRWFLSIMLMGVNNSNNQDDSEIAFETNHSNNKSF